MTPVNPGLTPATNRYGVDVDYFRREMAKLAESLPTRPPAELARYLQGLADVAAPGLTTGWALDAIRSKLAAIDENPTLRRAEDITVPVAWLRALTAPKPPGLTKGEATADEATVLITAWRAVRHLLAEFSRLSKAPAQAPAFDWSDPGHRLTEGDLDVVEKAYVESWRARRTDHGATRHGLECAIRAYLSINRATPRGTQPPARLYPSLAQAATLMDYSGIWWNGETFVCTSPEFTGYLDMKERRWIPTPPLPDTLEGKL